MSASRRLAFLSPLFLACGLSACGGGGTGGASNGGTAGAPPPAAKLTATVTSIKVTADTSQGGAGAANPAVINVPTSGNYFYELSFRGTAGLYPDVNGVTSVTYNTTNPTIGTTPELAYAIGGTIHGNWSSDAFGINMITLGDPATFGAGTYEDSITFEACADAACSQPLFGGPITIPVTYVVTGNPLPSTTNVIIYPNVTLEAPGDQTATTAGTIPVQAQGMPPTGAYVIPGTSAMGVVTQPSFASTLASGQGAWSNGTINFTLPAPKDIGAGVHTDTFPIRICFDPGCSKPESQGPWTGTVKYIVDPVPGQDYVQKSIDVAVGGIVWDAETARLYVITPAYSTLDPNELLVIDPSTGTIDKAMELDNGTGRIEPGTLAVSDDGQYLYVAVSDAPEQTDHVERLRTSDMGLDLTITLPAFETVNALQPAPGAPHTLAVETGGNLPALVIYQDATALANALSSSNGDMLTGFTWGAGASTLYATFSPPVIDAATVSASGLQVTQSEQLTSGIADAGMRFAGNMIYWGTGAVFDTATFTLGTAFTVDSPYLGATVDATLGRIFFVTEGQPPGSQSLEPTLETFALSGGPPVWLLRFPQQSGIGEVTRWGTNGLAFPAESGGANSLVIISGPIVTH